MTTATMTKPTVKTVPAPWTLEDGIYVADRADFPNGKAKCPSCNVNADQWGKMGISGNAVLFACRSCKAEIRITNEKVIETAAQKTMTATHDRAANHYAIAGSNGKGLDATEREINKLQHSVKVLSNQAMSMLIYDIPDTKNADCPNPSWILWRFGFRLNKSCWVLPEKSLRSHTVKNLLAHWQKHSIEAHVIPYHESALAQIRSIAREKLRQEVMRQHTSLIQRLQSAAQRHQEAVAELDASEEPKDKLDYVKAESKKDNETRSILKQAGEHLNIAVECAIAFDETESVQDLLKGLREVLTSETKLFNAEMRRKGSKTAPEVAA